MKFCEYLHKLRKQINIDKLFSLIYGLLDTMVIVFAFFPFYGQQDSKIILKCYYLTCNQQLTKYHASMVVLQPTLLLI